MLLILACDIGSSYTKVALLDGLKASGNIIHASYSKYLPLEQQSGAVWQKLLDNIASILDLYKNLTIEALCLSSHGPSLIAIDARGAPIVSPHNPIHRIHQLGDSQFRLGPSYYMPLARSMWALFSPEQRKSVACILPPANYIAYLLTGIACVPIPERYAHFYWPCTSGQPLDREFAHLLPKLRPLTDCVGYVQNNDALSSFAAVKGAAVFCPGVDFFAAEVGLNSSKASLLRNRTGTSEGFNLMLPPLPSTALENLLLPNGYFVNYHVMSQKPVLSYIQEGSGKLFEQLFQIWLQCEAKQIDREPEPSPIEMQAFATSYRHSQKALMLQQILEDSSSPILDKAKQFSDRLISKGLAYSEFLAIVQREFGQLHFSQLGLYTMQLLVHYFAHHCQTMFAIYQQLAGQEPLPQEVLLSGGQGYYPDWLQWKADHSGIAIHQASICEAEFIGAAAICYYKLGYFPSLEAASQQFLSIAKIYQPQR